MWFIFTNDANSDALADSFYFSTLQFIPGQCWSSVALTNIWPYTILPLRIHIFFCIDNRWDCYRYHLLTAVVLWYYRLYKINFPTLMCEAESALLSCRTCCCNSCLLLSIATEEYREYLWRVALSTGQDDITNGVFGHLQGVERPNT